MDDDEPEVTNVPKHGPIEVILAPRQCPHAVG